MVMCARFSVYMVHKAHSRAPCMDVHKAKVSNTYLCIHILQGQYCTSVQLDGNMEGLNSQVEHMVNKDHRKAVDIDDQTDNLYSSLHISYCNVFGDSHLCDMEVHTDDHMATNLRKVQYKQS